MAASTTSATAAAADGSKPSVPDSAFACSQCRQPLFFPHQLSDHQVGKHDFNWHKRSKDLKDADTTEVVGVATQSQQSQMQDEAAVTACSSWFLADSVKWMRAQLGEEQQCKLRCPKCSTRLGSIILYGTQCSCGTWVSPGIQILKKHTELRKFPPSAAPAPPVHTTSPSS